jgi:erythromycin esterase
MGQQPTPTVHARGDVLNAWIADHAVAVRSIDPMDEDFSDLEPLLDAIGSSRVVQLGEPSHGAGSSFAAKVRLIKFLHQRMGFDVLAWESGLYDVETSEAGLRAGVDAVASAQRGVLQIWSATEESRPLFEYAKESHASPHPLVMAGFDPQRTGPGAFEEFPAELTSFVGAVRVPALRDDAIQAATEVLAAFDDISAYMNAAAAYAAELSRAGTTGGARAEAFAAWERETGAALRPGRDAIERLRLAVDRLTELLDDNAEVFAEIGGERRRGFMARALVNLGFHGTQLYENFGVSASPVAPVVGENRRDALMAENLRWLIEEGYPDQKIIVWAHNAHVMNAYYEAPTFKSISLDPVPDAMKPMGVFLTEWLGDDVYTIGMTAYEGEDEWIRRPETAMAIPPAAEGSVEERLHRLGYAHAFLDLRSARGEADHPLGGPQTMRVPKYDSVEITDATQPYDAILYIARMEPATLIR